MYPSFGFLMVIDFGVLSDEMAPQYLEVYERIRMVLCNPQKRSRFRICEVPKRHSMNKISTDNSVFFSYQHKLVKNQRTKQELCKTSLTRNTNESIEQSGRQMVNTCRYTCAELCFASVARLVVLTSFTDSSNWISYTASTWMK
ncbi:hypothetical protein TNCV_5058831 [Trichonephila clavipes]|nr:hypothetical protein TNCV_5058831 [Trichonephila clavipes]